MKSWLLIDVSALAYRAMHVMASLSFEGETTGAVFGLFQSVISLQELFSTNRVVWCFDGGYGKRLEISRSYKQGRHEGKTEEEEQAYIDMQQQIKRLRVDYLPAVGFKNIFWQKGYEADDVIASVCNNLPRGEQAIIVSSDSDLFQLLSEDKVSVWLPSKSKSVTWSSFFRERGINPSMWADVKAIAGCSSDHVIGIRGVGEKTAIKFLSGQLKLETKAHHAIVTGNSIWRGNLRLVELPFPGTQDFHVQDDHIEEGAWEQLMDRLGMKTLKKDRRSRRVGFGL